MSKLVSCPICKGEGNIDADVTSTISTKEMCKECGGIGWVCETCSTAPIAVVNSTF